MEDFKILFVDDETEILKIVEEFLTRTGYDVTVLDDGRAALELIKETDFDVVFTDLNMPRFSGLQLLSSVKSISPETEVVIVTGFGTVESAIEALKLGCYDYLQKPIKLERLRLLVDRIHEKRRLQQENVIIKRRLKERYRYDELVGVSPKMQEIYDVIDRINESAPTVLIEGESGTGKEVVARVIHQNSICRDKPFIPVNCGAMVEGLLETELFGHVRGAFTGAVRDKMGLFKAAERGTIFLDEIAELTPNLQVKLLRVLQEKKIRPVGDTVESEVEVRVIAATNRNLEEAIQSGAMRKDLFYRLNVVSMKLPPLCERKEDIPLFVNYFLNKFNVLSKRKVTRISPEAMNALLSYNWPGNVRQLENAIERAFVLGLGDSIEMKDLPSEIREAMGSGVRFGGSLSLRENEMILMKEALTQTSGNKAEAAGLLGINVTTLYRKLKRYDKAFAEY
jgi:DNA-binding NtrC family response regulator